MAKLKLSLPKIDLDAVKYQFQGLQGRHPGLWPGIPKVSALIALAAVLLGLAYTFYWRGLQAELDEGKAKEDALKVTYSANLKKSINLPALVEQKKQVSRYVTALEKQLPSKSEMDALLSDINQAGVGRGLQFELFKPGQVAVKEYYAELPIAVRVVGSYHDMGAFASDIANLSRIVTLNNLQVQVQDKTLLLSMDAVAKTFRYLDEEEVRQQQAAALKAKQGAPK
jgi:type IV pilus assembly protein PilO